VVATALSQYLVVAATGKNVVALLRPEYGVIAGEQRGFKFAGIAGAKQDSEFPAAVLARQLQGDLARLVKERNVRHPAVDKHLAIILEARSLYRQDIIGLHVGEARQSRFLDDGLHIARDPFPDGTVIRGGNLDLAHLMVSLSCCM
jgi:hypothetical protein